MLSFVAQAQGKTWHVAAAPLSQIAADSQTRTIRDAVALAQAGDIILLHGGIYREQVTIDKSGEPNRPIVLRAAEGETVVLTGADRLTDWTPIPGAERVYSTPWPHKFVTWNKSNAHPDDDYHRVIGRCEQVFVNGYPLRQVLAKEQVSRGTFFVDLDAGRLYVQSADNRDLTGDKATIEASSRDRILVVKGNYVTVEGIRFRYAANHAQQGAAAFSGDHVTIENCVFEHTNASGAEFAGEDIVVRNCTFQHNGQLGFGASRAHRLLLTGCTIRDNNVKGFDRGWEAGGDKICLTRGAVLEHSTFVENRGNGIWFDIGNEDCEIRNCLIANNEDAGIFYEISFGLQAHDNVIVGNGLADTRGAWGAAAGVSLSSSPGCIVERNLILGNKEGFDFREQQRSTPRIDNKKSEPVWNHEETIRNNVLAWNRDAQVWGWFDVGDERHWPKSMQDASSVARPSSLEDLNLRFENNLYYPAPGQGLFNWGTAWKKHAYYNTLEAVQKELSLDQNSRIAEFHVEDFHSLDLHVPGGSPVLTMDCYPHGTIPGVRLGPVP
ncbi:MAG: right-handed parallel beta-helix repeat-containing protein [Phycisphaerales bacterium]